YQISRPALLLTIDLRNLKTGAPTQRRKSSSPTPSGETQGDNRSDERVCRGGGRADSHTAKRRGNERHPGHAQHGGQSGGDRAPPASSAPNVTSSWTSRAGGRHRGANTSSHRG